MAPFRTFVRSSNAAIAALIFAGCSFQNFDYLKGEYKSGNGGAGGASAAGGVSAGSGNADAGSGATSGSGASSGASPSGGSSDAAGAGGNGEPPNGQAGEGGAPPVPVGMLLNSGFELGSDTNVVDWVSVGATAAATIVHQQAHSGSGRLGHWWKNPADGVSSAYTVSTSQVVQPLPNGNYTFSIWVEHDLSLGPNEYIFARGYSHAQPGAQMKLNTMTANDTTYTQIVLEHIPVTSGSCEVGIYTAGGPDSATNWSLIDDAALTLEP